MAIMRWTPSGALDVATDPTELPQQSDGKNVVSGAMTRCTNMHLDRQGIAQTRKGYRRLNSSPLSAAPLDIIVQDGLRYSFSSDTIYRNEQSICHGMLGDSRWGILRYQAYNSVVEELFASNLTDRKRIRYTTKTTWDNIESPSLAPTVTSGYDYARTQGWEESGSHVVLFKSYNWETAQAAGLVGADLDDEYENRFMWAFEITFDPGRKYGVCYTYFGESHESNPSPKSTAVKMESGLSVTLPSKCDDSRVTHLRIYRPKETDPSTYYFDHSVALGTTKTVLLMRDEDMGTVVVESDIQNTCVGVYEWGIDAPEDIPVLSKGFNYVYISSWELDTQLGVGTFHVSREPFSEVSHTVLGLMEYVQDWEEKHIFGEDSIYPNTNTHEVMYRFEIANANLDQKFGVVFTWCRKNEDVLECESNPSPVTYSQTDSGISVTIPATCSDPQVTHARIYRTLGDGADYYFDTEVEIGDTHVVLIKRDEALGTSAPDNHDRPIASNILCGPVFNGYMFLAHGNKLYYSLPQQPEYWPTLYYIEIGSEQFPITALTILGGVVYAATAIEIYMVQGTGAGAFSALPMGSMTGTQSRLAFCAIHGSGIYHLGTDGVYLFRPGADARITDQYFRPIMMGESVGAIPGMKISKMEDCWLHHFKGRLWFGYQTVGTEYPANVLITDVAKQRTIHYQYGIEFSTLVNDYDNDRVLGLDSTGYVVEVDYGELDIGRDIAWEIESKEFGELRKYFPRSARWDVVLNNGASATGKVVLDGEIAQIHPITESRQTKRRLIAGCNGDRLSLRISGSGPVSIYGAEAE